MRTGAVDAEQVRSGQYRIRSFTGIISALTIGAAALVWYRIGHDSLWLDESGSLLLVRENSWTEIWTSDNGNMALYYGLLKVWRAYADSEATIRLLSAVPFVLTVPVIGLLGRRAGDDRVGLLAAAIVASHPFFVRYGQEARGFSLVTFLVTAGVLGLAVGVQQRRRGVFLAGIALLAIAPYAHPIAALTATALVAWLWWLPAERLPVRRSWIVAITVAIVAPLAIVVASAGSSQISWTGRGEHNPVLSLLSTIWHVVSDTPAALVIGGLAIAGCVFTVAKLRCKGRSVDGWLDGVAAAWVIGTGGAVVIVSLRQSLFVPRYLLLVAPAVAWLAAAAAVQLRSRLVACALVAAAALNAGVVIARGAEYARRTGGRRRHTWRRGPGRAMGSCSHPRPRPCRSSITRFGTGPSLRSRWSREGSGGTSRIRSTRSPATPPPTWTPMPSPNSVDYGS